MSAGEQHQIFEQALLEVEGRLRHRPDDLDARFERARLLTRLGRDDEAKAAYVALLQRDSTHLAALTNLGALALAGGYRAAALTAYRQAASAHPAAPAAHINLANVLLADGHLDEARAHYEAALAFDGASAEAHRGIAQILVALGEEIAAEQHLRAGTAGAAIVSIPFRGAGQPVDVLLLVSARGGNIPTELLLSDRIHAVSALYVEGWEPDTPLSQHDLVFNAIGDADLCAAALVRAEQILQTTRAPVVNRPEAVRATTRENNATRFAGETGIVAPRAMRLPKTFVAQPAEIQRFGFSFPLLLRTPGFHTGQHFARVDDPSGLASAAARLPGRDAIAIQYRDARGADALWRKYRVMMIGGALYPLHLAASATWKVHYFTSAMSENAELRNEERAFLDAMPEVLGPRAMGALERIAEVLALDYAGIDFGITPDGDLLFFEANATMVMVRPGPDSMWDYRGPAIARAIAAAQRLFARPG